MVIRRYPDDIKKLMDIFDPYTHEILSGNLDSVPQTAIDAYNKVKEWSFEQGQQPPNTSNRESQYAVPCFIELFSPMGALAPAMEHCPKTGRS